MAAPRKRSSASIKKKMRSIKKAMSGKGPPSRAEQRKGKPPRQGGPPGATEFEGLPPLPKGYVVSEEGTLERSRPSTASSPTREQPPRKERKDRAARPARTERPERPPRAEGAERPPRTPKPPRPPGRRGPPSIVATVEPLTIGAPGAIITAFGRRFSVSAGVPGDRLRVVLPRRADPSNAKARAEDDLPPARRLELVEAAPHRVQAPCAQLERCGACSLQELRYGQQLAAKAQALRMQLAPLGAEVASQARVRALKNPFAYRTRLLMAAGGVPGRLRFGFYERGAFGEPVPAEGCPVQHPLTLALLAMATQVLDAANVAPTNADDPRLGWLHGLSIRIDPIRSRGEITLLGKTEQLPRGPALAEQLASLPGVDAVHLSISPKRSSYPLSDVMVHLAGGKRTVFTLAGQSFPLSPGTFFQTCHEGAELLAELVLELLPTRFDCLADVYGGVGVFSRLTAGRWERAVVAEASPSAVADLEAALSKNDRLPLRIIPGRVEQTIRRVLGANPDVVLLDPPRRGCQRPVIEEIGKAAPATVLYLACGMDALLRDGRALLAAGYRLDVAQAIDMFPHTPHLEVVARFAYDPPACQ